MVSLATNTKINVLYHKDESEIKSKYELKLFTFKTIHHHLKCQTTIVTINSSCWKLKQIVAWNIQ